MSDKYVWVIAGGLLQLPLINEIKKRGYKIIVSDMDVDAPGMKIADHAIVCDTYDEYGHCDVARSMQNDKPVAVLTAGADVGPTVSAVAEELGLLAEKHSVATLCRNKALLRNKLNANNPVFLEMYYGEPTPHTDWKRHCAIHGIEPYPCVVKPLDRPGSKGVGLVRGAFGWYDAMKNARIANMKRHRTFIVEQCLYGEEVSSDWMVNKSGNIVLVNAAYRIFDKSRFGIELGHINPYNPPKEFIKLAKETAKKLGITFGAFKFDAICDERYGWVVMEVATRLSGGFDHMVTGKLIGKDVTGIMLDLALGKGISRKKLKKNGKVACAYTPVLKPGKVKEWRIPDNIDQYYLLSPDEIRPLGDCAKRPLFLITTGNSAFEAYRKARVAEKELEVIYV